jgi:hypothetical protein
MKEKDKLQMGMAMPDSKLPPMSEPIKGDAYNKGEAAGAAYVDDNLHALRDEDLEITGCPYSTSVFVDIGQRLEWLRGYFDHVVAAICADWEERRAFDERDAPFDHCDCELCEQARAALDDEAEEEPPAESENVTA